MTHITDHQIKIKRAMRLADIGRHPGSASAMLGAIPASVIAGLTSAQLAEMIDALWATCQEAKGIAARDAVEGGAIWVGDCRYEVTS